MPLSVGYAHWHYSADVANARNVGGWCWAEGEISDFIGAASLREDVIWLTNLPWEYHIALGADKFPHIKRNDFLPVPLERLAQELAISPETPDIYANALAVIGSRLLALGQRCYGHSLLQHCMSTNTLAQAIAHTIGWNQGLDPDALNTELHHDIIWHNLTPNAVLRHDVLREDCAVFRAPWFGHAKQVLACPMPSLHDEWTEIEIGAADRLAFLREQEMPAVVEVHSAVLPPSWDAIYDFASTPHRWSRRRRWMSSIEVLFLAELGAVEIGRILVQPSGYVCDAMAWSLPNAGDALALSISAGMLAHAHWLSGAIALTHRFWPARAMWVRSADRLRLANLLPVLQGIRGLKLVAYGEGAVFASGPSEAIATAIHRAPSVGLSPTPSAWAMTEDRSIFRDPAWVPQEMSAYEQTALRLSHRPIADLLRLDAASISSLTDQHAAIREISVLLKEFAHA